MHMFRKLSTQAIACVVLSSHVIGVDGALDPAQPRTPSRTPPQRLAPLSPTMPSSPLRKMPDRIFRNWLEANREWFIDGRRVIFCDLEAVPTIGGPITEATFIETQFGQATGEIRHYYLNPETKVKHPKVKKIDPIDPRQQPTFAQIGSTIFDFIKDATLVTYGPFDARKLMEHFSYLPPYGTVYEITYVDALTMTKNDYARELGLEVNDTPQKKVSVTSKPLTEVKKEQAIKRKKNKLAKELREENKENKRIKAKQQGKPSPQPKKRKSKFGDVKFSQTKVADRYEIDDLFAATLIGLDANHAYQSQGVPAAHRGVDHHSFTDTLKLAGIGTLLTQKQVEFEINRTRLLHITKGLNFDEDIELFRYILDDSSEETPENVRDIADERSDPTPPTTDELKLKRARSTSKAEKVLNSSNEEEEDLVEDVRAPSPAKKRAKATPAPIAPIAGDDADVYL